MKTIEFENVFCTDIDDTIVMYNKKASDDLIEFDYYGEKRYLRIHKAHISFLRALKQRGYFIIAWTANGYPWAEEVMKKLKLDDIIDQCMTKPTRVLDDVKINKWCRTIFIPEES